ncbi:MAG: hypothetical protein NWQ54_10360 [Paraglaciecola sp.]|uniref:hypothetical protein n=1 Tax=Pseudomonadati TaxID=3379134 RepID=UPI00273E02B8|nr:hypothetical protein [Paraglaciecola sp.]MDP5031628.1 hypothetical protein [Paraglaciecola sp.]MDP5131279.1 hypothetical protein [Paraglaciecola sp.]
MAKLHALSTQSQRSTVVQQIVAPQFSLQSQGLNQQKWTYLLANHIQFNEKADFVIKLPKPQTVTLKEWLEKIITSGQCNLLFVEQLSIDEIAHHRIQQLCAMHNVTLINLLPNKKTSAQIVQGPW